MADLIPPMLIQLQADVSQLKVGLAQAESALKGVDNSVKTASTGMSNFVNKMKQVGATIGVAFAGQQVVQFGKDIIMAASDMNESLSKMQVVFGKNADAVEKWANTSADAMGLSKQAAVEAAGTYGNLFQAFGLGQPEATKMSTTLVQLASDMASFNNTSIDDAILALRSGLSGETEPLKKFGVALSDARLKNEALAMGLIKSTSDALTPAAKAQASYALIMKDTTLAQGDYGRTADGTANTMRTLQAKMEDAKASLGAGLLPAFQALLLALKPLLTSLAAFGKFLADNKEAVTTFIVVLSAGAVAWGVYELAVNRAKIAQAALNLVQKANPIGLIITAVALLAAGFVMLWNKSEAFRKVVIEVGKAGVNAFAFIIKMVGELVTGVMKFVSGPMRLLLMGLSALKVPGAKNALEGINKTIDATGKFFTAAATKVEGLNKKLDELAKKKTAVDTATNGVKKSTDKTIDDAANTISKSEEKRLSKLQDLKDKVAGIYEDMNQVILDAQEKAQKALEARNDEMIAAQERYNEEVVSLNQRYKEVIADAEQAYADKVADIKTRKEEADIAAQERYQETIANIEENYTNKKLDLQQNYENKVADLKANAAQKTSDLIKAANEKQLSIVQQSIDRLRSAFASKTGFSISESFAGGAQSADKLISDLKTKLQSIKDLQANAAELAGLGYSQVFIEEIVKQGPTAGNKIAEALKAASPEATKELQSLYGQVENVSNHGLDVLAESMNSGSKLATEELMNAYRQVSVDLSESLAKTNEDLTKNLADAQTAFNKAMTDNEASRTDALDKASKQLEKALADNLKTFEKAMADASEVLDKARIKAQEDLNKGLLQAQNQLQASLAKAQKDYEDSIAKINEDTQKKLEALRKKLEDAKKQMEELQGDTTGIYTNAPVYTPIIPVTTPANSAVNSTATTTTNINQVFSNATVDPSDVHLAVISAVKYGAAVTVAPTVNQVPKSFMSIGAYDK